MSSRLAAGIAIAILATAVLALAAQDEAELIRSPEVLTQSLSAAPTTTLDSADIHDFLPDESPTPPIQAEPVPTTSTPAVITDESSTTTAPSTTTVPPTTIPTTLAPGTTAPAASSGDFSAENENSFASLINSHRNANGLVALSRDSGLDAEARAWSQQMAAQGGLSHSELGRLLPPWTSVAENVAVGGSVSSIFGALTASSGHNANMLGDFTQLGVGVWVDSYGSVWTTHVFTR